MDDQILRIVSPKFSIFVWIEIWVVRTIPNWFDENNCNDISKEWRRKIEALRGGYSRDYEGIFLSGERLLVLREFAYLCLQLSVFDHTWLHAFHPFSPFRSLVGLKTFYCRFPLSPIHNSMVSHACQRVVFQVGSTLAPFHLLLQLRSMQKLQYLGDLGTLLLAWANDHRGFDQTVPPHLHFPNQRPGWFLRCQGMAGLR